MIKTSPLVGFNSPSIIPIVVVFPQPFGPNKPIISFTKNGIFSDELEHNNIGAAFNQNTTLTDFNSFLSSCQSLNYDNYDFSKFEISSEVNKLTAIIE